MCCYLFCACKFFWLFFLYFLVILFEFCLYLLLGRRCPAPLGRSAPFGGVPPPKRAVRAGLRPRTHRTAARLRTLVKQIKKQAKKRIKYNQSKCLTVWGSCVIILSKLNRGEKTYMQGNGKDQIKKLRVQNILLNEQNEKLKQEIEVLKQLLLEQEKNYEAKFASLKEQNEMEIKEKTLSDFNCMSK